MVEHGVCTKCRASKSKRLPLWLFFWSALNDSPAWTCEKKTCRLVGGGLWKASPPSSGLHTGFPKLLHDLKFLNVEHWDRLLFRTLACWSLISQSPYLQPCYKKKLKQSQVRRHTAPRIISSAGASKVPPWTLLSQKSRGKENHGSSSVVKSVFFQLRCGLKGAHFNINSQLTPNLHAIHSLFCPPHCSWSERPSSDFLLFKLAQNHQENCELSFARSWNHMGQYSMN